MKSVIERFLALILLAVLSPIFCCIGIVIWLYDRGPMLFLQERVGYQKKIFVVYKFRTMHNRYWPVEEKLGRDVRVTGPGHFLRKTHLDELPQLWNVVRGEMAFLGPRPTTVDLVKIYHRRYPRRYGNRFRLKPGMTGLAQVYMEKGDCHNLFRCIVLEEFYRQHRSLLLDTMIIIKTLVRMIRGTSY